MILIKTEFVVFAVEKLKGLYHKEQWVAQVLCIIKFVFCGLSVRQNSIQMSRMYIHMTRDMQPQTKGIKNLNQYCQPDKYQKSFVYLKILGNPSHKLLSVRCICALHSLCIMLKKGARIPLGPF
jgi:hypothetical protein